MIDNWLKRSIILRMAIIGFLTLALLVPSFLVMDLVSERTKRRDNAVAEVSEKWGAQQTLAGPILTLPFTRTIRTEAGETRTLLEHVQLMPERLVITATLTPEVRYRGIYQVTLYTAQAEVRGTFSLDGLSALNVRPGDVLWGDAVLTFGISDLKGINEAINVKWGDREFSGEPGTVTDNVLSSGINVKPTVSPDRQSYEFSMQILLNGSEEFQIVPVGRESNVNISSPWTSPSFAGRFLPDSRTVGESGFEAKWTVLHLNRNFPQHWIRERLSAGEGAGLHDFSLGVKLLSPIDHYQQTMRSAKYAVMFIALTFLAFFLTEILTKKVGHPVHYVLIGFALVLFYLLLLSLSEHMPFVAAYIISSVAVVAMVGAYSRSIFGTNRFPATISSLLILLYTFLFVILQEEDYALLFGSLGLFVVLALVMYLTRKIDWYEASKQEEAV